MLLFSILVSRTSVGGRGWASNWAALMLTASAFGSQRCGEREGREKTFFLFLFYFGRKVCWCCCYFLGVARSDVLCVHSRALYTHLPPHRKNQTPPARFHNIQHHKSDPFLRWMLREWAGESGGDGDVSLSRHPSGEKLKALQLIWWGELFYFHASPFLSSCLLLYCCLLPQLMLELVMLWCFVCFRVWGLVLCFFFLLPSLCDCINLYSFYYTQGSRMWRAWAAKGDFLFLLLLALFPDERIMGKGKRVRGEKLLHVSLLPAISSPSTVSAKRGMANMKDHNGSGLVRAVQAMRLIGSSELVRK